MELCDGDLSQNLEAKKMSEKEILEFTQQMSNASRFLVEKGIIHRDIKPENIFIQNDPIFGIVYKLADFGCVNCKA